MSEFERASIRWEGTGDGEHPYRARVDGRDLAVRVNDFPAEPLYTLLVDGTTVAELEDWPPSWVRPARVVRTDPLTGWATLLCSSEEPSTDLVLRRLGLAGALDEPPNGLSAVQVSGVVPGGSNP